MLWLKMLQSKVGSSASRIRAIEQIGASNDPRAVEVLAGEIFNDTEQGGDVEVKRAAVEMLGKIDHPEALKVLVNILDQGRSDVMAKAADALIEQNEPATIPWLVRALREFDPNTLFAVQRALTHFGEESVPHLLKALTDVNRTVQRAAAETLYKLGAPAVPQLLTHLREGNAETRDAVHGVLVRVAQSTKEPFIKALQDESIPVRKTAAHILGELKATVAAPFLAKQLRTDRDGRVREYIANALQALDWKPTGAEETACFAVAARDWEKTATLGSTAVAPLAICLAHLEDGVWEIPGEQLIDLGQEATPHLAALLESPDEWARARAVRVLIEIGGPEAEQAMARTIKDPSQEVRLSTVLALWKPQGGPVAADILMRALDDDEMLIRSRAARALGENGDPRARAPLLDLIKTCPGVEVDATLALARIAPAEVFPKLLEMSVEVATAEEAIAALAGILERVPGEIDSALLEEAVRLHRAVARDEVDEDDPVKKTDGSRVRGLAMAELGKRGVPS
ncbi:MAG: HEAT repeat domain-containing protein [Gemmataceae bacterium]